MDWFLHRTARNGWARYKHRIYFHIPGGGKAHEQIRALFRDLALELARVLPDCGERDKAVDALDVACMYANAAVARVGNYLEPPEPAGRGVLLGVAEPPADDPPDPPAGVGG